MDYTISLEAVFWLSAGIAGLIALIRTLIKPFRQLDSHERRLKKLEKVADDRKENDILMLKSMNAIVNHMIDGNGIDKLREARDEMQKTFIEHHI